jgi:sugar phosphate isomerase/epimerase
MRRLSIAAGMLLDVEPGEAVRIAADAGYDALGLRFAPPGPDDAAVAALRAAVGEAGLGVLDIEFVRLTAEDEAGAWHRRLVEIGTGLGAEHLIVISVDEDRSRTRERYAALCELAGSMGGLQPTFEFMLPTAVRRLDDALEVIAGVSGGAVLVDALHLHRGGTPPERLRDVDERLLPYLQICDAPETPPGDDDATLMHEARHGRVLPGEGALPLRRLLEAAPPQAPLSVEVLSRDLMEGMAPAERATAALATTRLTLGGQPKRTG